MESIGARLKATRVANKMTQAEVSRRSGVKQSDISKLENGAVAGTTKIVQLAVSVGCDPVWLATGEGKPGYFDPRKYDHWQPVPSMIPVAGASAFEDAGIEIDTADPSTKGGLAGIDLDGAYAVKVRGDRHAPALRDGNFAVMQRKPTVVGDLGLFTLVGGRVLLRELIRETPETYHLDLPKWGARHTIARSEVEDVHHVIAVVAGSLWSGI
ncbi:XRE family transcriptional regulator [uncultured Pseudacidovorax sp.]|uniref:XRE family transcriptional regulator n=1 Tax=uncultured Pseudacidovorax sp. TaxID=679313 RepID=UPI0025D6B493|nr:XRE family transcriptional regulator [uncultured Pseudacidovorax sp.]